jgi:hypothetical protein
LPHRPDGISVKPEWHTQTASTVQVHVSACGKQHPPGPNWTQPNEVSSEWPLKLPWHWPGSGTHVPPSAPHVGPPIELLELLELLVELVEPPPPPLPPLAVPHAARQSESAKVERGASRSMVVVLARGVRARERGLRAIDGASSHAVTAHTRRSTIASASRWSGSMTRRSGRPLRRTPAAEHHRQPQPDQPSGPKL